MANEQSHAETQRAAKNLALDIMLPSIVPSAGSCERVLSICNLIATIYELHGVLALDTDT